MTKKLIIIGASEIARIAHFYFTDDSDYEVAAFAVDKDYRDNDNFMGLPLIDFEDILQEYPPSQYHAFAAIGSQQLNRVRNHFVDALRKLNYTLASFIHSSNIIASNAKIGEHAYILEANIVQAFVEIGNNVTFWTNNHIGHGTVIKDNCFLASGVTISGNVILRENCFIGVNACLAEGVDVGKDNFIAMAAAVNKSCKEDSLMIGVPAKSRDISARKFCGVDEDGF